MCLYNNVGSSLSASLYWLSNGKFSVLLSKCVSMLIFMPLKLHC
uniref:Uncharacterized protein n=1 Tax=Anguilla anguilla TaxID=7936 RepID=A0A0E9VQS6_ANGAN